MPTHEAFVHPFRLPYRGEERMLISIFAVLLHSKKQNDPEGSFSVYRKASQSFASADAKDV